MAALSPVRTPSGLVAIVARHIATAGEISAVPDAFVLAAVDVQDPGNVGALMRAAEAGGITGMYVCGASANPFSWKSVRGSMGSALRLPVVGGLKTSDVLSCMKTSGMRTVAAVTRGGADPEAIDWNGKVGIVLGGEGPGLSDDVVVSCDAHVSIPMAPRVESLNVATAGAILIYAARRHRTQSMLKAEGSGA
jgi:TrmH family RNA methyltransferase